MIVGARYRHVDAGLIRVAAFPADSVPRLWSWPDGDTTDEQWLGWLSKAWAAEHVAEAVRLASPPLAGRIDAICGGQRARMGDARRLAMPLARYLTRMRGRATPFGLFAGVAPLRSGPGPGTADLAVKGAAVRADAMWLADVIRQLESYAELLQHLPVVANDLATVRGERLVVPWQPCGTGDVPLSAAEVAVRYSDAVRAAVEAAQSPIQCADLAGKLAAGFPAAAPAAALKLIATLVGCGVLITSLRPPSTSPDGLTHVLGQLSTTVELGPAAGLVAELRIIAAGLEAASRAPARSAGGARLAVDHRMRALAGASDRPVLAVDLLLSGEVAVPETVTEEADAAAGALVRLAAHPDGHPGWQEYHVRFLERYGAGAVVPLAQLTDPVAGLGFPSHYTEPSPSPARVPMSRRDERLLALAQDAAIDGAREIVLDNDTIGQLAGDVAGEPRPAPHAELCADLRAASLEQLSAGDFTLAITGVSRSALAMTGRFIAGLPVPDRMRMSAAYAGLPTVTDGAVTAQLSFPPRHPRLENVTRIPVVLPVTVSLAEHHPGGPDRIPPQDLAVTADNDGLYVVSLSRHQVIEPVVVNAASREAMPPAARLLSEIPRARLAALTPFAWGAASGLPFLPRLRYQRSILAAARWRIPRRALPGPGASWAAWEAAADQLRSRLRLPATIDAGAGDRKLRLNLDQPADLMLFRDLLGGAEQVTVSEAPAAADHGWLGGRAHEIVIPVASAAPAARPPAIMTAPGPWIRAGSLSSFLPGSRVLSAKLYGHPDCFDVILTAHLPGLLAEWDGPPAWWFVRYRDPAPHLRLRLHLENPPEYGLAAVRVGAWADRLRRGGLITDLVLAAYWPETARYGTGITLAAAETLFAMDSAAAVAQLAMQAAAPGIRSRALTAASLADLVTAMSGGQEAGTSWLIRHPGPAGTARASEGDRTVLRQALALAGADTTGTGLLAHPGGQHVAAAWQARAEAAAAYARHVAEPCSGLRPDAVLGTLLHMHHARIHGPGADCESACRRLTRAIAMARAARADAAGRSQR